MKKHLRLLLRAISSRRLDRVRQGLRLHGTSLNDEGPLPATGVTVTPLTLAVDGGSTEIVTALIEAGADVNKGPATFVPLMIACDYGREELVQLLLEAGADPNLRVRGSPYRGETALRMACTRGHMGIVRRLLAAGADPKVVAGDGWTALTASCQQANIELPRLLIDAGCPVRGPDVLAAATAGNARLVELLLARGGKPDYVDEGRASRNLRGQTPLGIAVLNAQQDIGAEGFASRTDVALVLLNAGADPNLCMHDVAPLGRAAFLGNERIVRALVKAGADKESVSVAGHTPLGSAAEMGHAQVVKVLLAAGAKPDGKGLDGRGNPGSTPMELAKRKGFTEIVRLLQKAGAKG